MFIKTRLLAQAQIHLKTLSIILPDASLLPNMTYIHTLTLVLAMLSVISLLHTVFDGGPDVIIHIPHPVIGIH